MGEGRTEGECSRCGSYIVFHRQTGEPIVAQRAAREQRPRGVFWPVVGALLFVFILLPILLFVGCGACAAAGYAGVTIEWTSIWLVVGCLVVAGVILWIVERYGARR